MSLLAANYSTLLDWANKTDPKGAPAMIIEMLSQNNEIMDDIPYIEGNLPTGHRHTVRTGLPSGTWRKLYQGVQPTKSTTAQVTDTIGMLEAYSEPDKAEADLNGNTKAFRMDEATAHMEGMGQQLASAFFYSDESVNPEQFTGLAPRFNDLSASNADNIIDAGGTGSDNTSIWLIGWGKKKVHGIFPKGQSANAGISHEDLGQQTVQLSDNSRYEAYRDHFKFSGGFAVPDWRYVVRICNIDVSDLTKDAATGADLFNLLAQALETIHSLDGNAKFYGNRTISSFLRQQQIEVNNVRIRMAEAAGKRVMTIDDTPFRRVDAIVNTEARVT